MKEKDNFGLINGNCRKILERRFLLKHFPLDYRVPLFSLFVVENFKKDWAIWLTARVEHLRENRIDEKSIFALGIFVTFSFARSLSNTRLKNNFLNEGNEGKR